MGMKERYDISIIDRTFVVGDEVLVLLPEGSGKLTAQWQGPYSIDHVSPVTYAEDMPHHWKRRRIVHVNTL